MDTRPPKGAPDQGSPDPDLGLDPGVDPEFGLGDEDSQRIGLSVEGRALRAWRFGPDGAPALLVVAGVHGDEPSSVGGAVELGRRLRAGAVAAAGPVWLMPRLNPDGLARGQKNSARDVDLNRNFPAANFTTAHRPGYFPGDGPLSEPETAALAALIERERIGAVVAVHAPFACVNYDGPAQAWAAAGRRRLRLAGARRHRLSDAGLAGQLARRRPRPAGADAGAAAGAARRLS